MSIISNYWPWGWGEVLSYKYFSSCPLDPHPANPTLLTYFPLTWPHYEKITRQPYRDNCYYTSNKTPLVFELSSSHRRFETDPTKTTCFLSQLFVCYEQCTIFVSKVYVQQLLMNCTGNMTHDHLILHFEIWRNKLFPHVYASKWSSGQFLGVDPHFSNQFHKLFWQSAVTIDIDDLFVHADFCKCSRTFFNDGSDGASRML